MHDSLPLASDRREFPPGAHSPRTPASTAPRAWHGSSTSS